jgi:hypothetical protein
MSQEFFRINFKMRRKKRSKLAESEEGKLDGFTGAAPHIHELCQSSQEVVTPPIVINRALARIADR